MMENLIIHQHYLIKVFGMAKLMLRKPIGIFYAIFTFTTPVFTTCQKALLLLAALFVLDFITGIAASYIEARQNKSVSGTIQKGYVLSSAKLRLSAVKFITYALAALCAYGIEVIFFIREFEPHLVTQKLTLTTIVIAFFCVIEFYSVFFENIKRMGFDIAGTFKKIILVVWDIYISAKGK